jgi:formate dehydrogenase major subunit
MFDAAIEAPTGPYVQGEDIPRPTQHRAWWRRCRRWNACTQADLFLNKPRTTPIPAGIDLPEGRHLINAERRIQRVRKVMTPRNDSATESLPASRDGFEMRYNHPSEIMDEIAALTRPLPAFPTQSSTNSARCNGPATNRRQARLSCISTVCARQGQVRGHRIYPRPTSARPRFPLLLTTGRILSQYNVGAQTRRTDNVVWHSEDRLKSTP